MKLKQLIQGIEFQRIHGSREREISGLSSDSRAVAFGNVFIAKKGYRWDGEQFMRQAVDAGASAIVTSFYDPFLPSVTQLIHPRPEEIEPLLAAAYYAQPSKELFVVGVTGSKGKTTSTYLIRHLLEKRLGGAGLSGTIEVWVGEKRYPSLLTTQDVIFHHKMLREMRMHLLPAAVLEISSHGLAQRRVAGVAFDVALCTNLFPDHLDYHETEAAYVAAKRMLCTQLEQSVKKNKRMMFNGDDERVVRMMEGLVVPSLTFGMNERVALRAVSVEQRTQEVAFWAEYQGQKARFTLPLLGRYNVYNALGAMAVGLHLGASLEEMSGLWNDLPAIPGRLEKVGLSARGAQLFVDYAHTGESLREVLKVLREIASRRIVVVFGCGGNRDPARRRGMAEAAEAYADIAIVTTDNPRQEDPEEIARQVVAGFHSREKVLLEPDRVEAIRTAVQIAERGDLILVAGKGHERVQIFAHQTVPFDDVEVAGKILREVGL